MSLSAFLTQGIKLFFKRFFSNEAAYREYGYRLNEIAKYLGVHYSTASHRLKALELS